MSSLDALSPSNPNRCLGLRDLLLNPDQTHLNINSSNNTHTHNTKGSSCRSAQSNSIQTRHPQENPSSQPETMSFWQSYRNLHPRTRLFIGGGLVAYAAFGLMASDQIEQYLGWTATEEDRKRLPQVHMVDRREK